MASTTTTTTTTTAGTPDIDALLTTYLSLLDIYTTLRNKLTALQSSTSLSLARANFSTPHQMGYMSGSNAKLRASVRLRVVPPGDDQSDDDSEGEEEDEVFNILPVEHIPTTSEPTVDEEGEEDGDADDADDSEGEGVDTDSTPTAAKQPQAPPLPHIFGVLAPPSLREAQMSAIQAVDVIAQLAGVEVRMRGVEVEVRRARKRAFKAEKGR
ncbi:hypothetical protein VF21_03892 [Pseudogymnoascus sp. 05NY08]|nr:hypothetical protein VF21_03892 [Pseudogymnoascus sp. 05NY08]